MSIKLPKQWKHWCKKAGLKPEGLNSHFNKRPWAWHSLVGHGRRFRINCHGFLDISCLNEDFDRWANSFEAGLPLTATNEREFILLVDLLRAMAATESGEIE